MDMADSHKIPTTAESWHPDMPRRISVNNLGVGGSNVHVIVESLDSYIKSTGMQLPARVPRLLESSSSTANNGQPQKCLITMSAMTENSLRKRVQALTSYCESRLDDHILGSLAHTLSKRWEGFPWRWSVAASSMPELLEKLKDTSCSPRHASSKPKVGFVFAGQGAQWFAMGRELLSSYPAFHASMVAADRVYRDLGAEWSLIGKFPSFFIPCCDFPYFTSSLCFLYYHSY
jgi:acyl transferase domain-containing protein